MEEKKMTEKESMELIATMIAKTRRHLTRGEGNMLLFWGYLCAIVTVMDFIFVYLRYGAGINIPFRPDWIWWLIPLIGIPYTIIVKHRKANDRTVMTYTDKISLNLWNYVLWLAVIAICIGGLFSIVGFSIWYWMMPFIFFVVGMAASFQGMIINEKTMIWGGAFSVLSGGFLVAGILAGSTWMRMWTGPLFIIAFIVMMIIPGHILNHKAKQA